MKIGLFGGTFNPLHNGHLIIAEAAREYFSLDTVIFIPTCRPPHKNFNPEIPDSKRLSLLVQAIIDNPFFRVSDFEFQNSVPSYAIDTVKYFKKEYPDSSLLYIIGEDHIPVLKNWKNIETLQNEVLFIVAERGGIEPGEETPYRIKKFPAPRIEISSTEIRKRCREGESIRYLVPDSVYKAIAEEGLYSEEKKGT